MRAFRLILASASPRRLDLLRRTGLVPTVVPAGLTEEGRPGETPRDQVARLAEDKARRVARRFEPGREPPPREPEGPDAPAVILAADTTVVLDGEALGKPEGPAAAEEMLGRLRGRTHEVLTGVFLMRADDGRWSRGLEISRIRFRPYGDDTIRRYVASGEPLDKAGAYGIQGRGALLVDRIEGSWSNVVGLPVERLPDWMERLGFDLADLI